MAGLFRTLVILLVCGVVQGQLLIVDLSNQNLTQVPRDSIDVNATDVVLSNNNITEIRDFDFANLPDLKKVDASSNLIVAVSKLAFVNSTKVNRLVFSHNLLTCVCDLSFPELSLVTVNIESNPLNEIQAEDLRGFPSIYTLHLRDTGITSFPNCTYIGDTLGYLLINHNKFTTIDPELLATAPNLEKLELSATGLNSVPDFSSFPGRFGMTYLNLNYIWAIGQSLQASDFDDLPALKYFHLIFSSLSAFPDFGAAKASLEEVFLTGNKIATVEPTRLQGFPNLRKLDLAQNRLASFPDVRGLGLNLEKLDLTKNELICEDSTRWIEDVLERGLIDKFRVEDPCYQPPRHESAVFTKESEGLEAGAVDGDEVAVCVCRCRLDVTCVAVSFRPACVLEQLLPSSEASFQWWAKNV